VSAQGGKPAPTQFEIDPEKGRVVRRDGKGEAWSTPLAGNLGGVTPPHLVADAKRVYVSHADGVTALSATTGTVLWHAKGPSDCLLCSGNLLLAARGNLVTARAVTTGADVFQVRLPVRRPEGGPFSFEPGPIQEVAGLFLVQTGELPGGAGDAFLLDRTGKVRHRFARQVVTGLLQGSDRVFLTSRDVVRLSEGKARWAAPFEQHQWIAGGGLVELKGGDLLAFRYGCIRDSGVDLLRLNPTTGKAVWRAWCAGLGVGHSEYSHHATVAVEGETLRVTSRGSDGTFVEFLNLTTGKRHKRIVQKN
jgi:outer membrane protein assembly factor BamB